MKSRYWVSICVGLVLGLSVPFQELLFSVLNAKFQLLIQNPYPGWTYFILFLLSSPTAVAIAKLYNFIPVVNYDTLLKIAIMVHFSFVLPPILVASFGFIDGQDLGAGAFSAIVGISLLACFAAAALQAVIIEKILIKS